MSIIWLLLLSGSAFSIFLMLQPAITLPSRPITYGSYAATATLFGGGIIIFICFVLNKWILLPNWVMYSAMLIATLSSILHTHFLQRRQLYARAGFEYILLAILVIATLLATMTAIGIILAIATEAIYFFQYISITDFLFGTVWSPQIAIRADQVAAHGAFGVIPLITGTFMITAIAMLVATPTGIIIATYLSEFAPKRIRTNIKPVLELLAGVPTVVYGFFAVVILSPILHDLGLTIGIQIASESALAAGMVMGVMLIPFITSLSEDALFAVPDTLRQGALALGSTPFETAFKVAIPSALPGIISSILLALSRAIGETMIVVMAAGISATLTVNPLEAVTTITVQIVTLLTGDQEFNDPKTLAAFALGLILFITTLTLNLFSLRIIRRYQQSYE
ncbi:Phosphate transport system permease protein PstC (TC 3.A.1.7.1) [uncultured Candidatus Thioglobus sp.]|nr:Phosphate transport system permease protein PstC (TC 3.A.1.7.1) [uncultured Candidatus Thioglobus sp.]